VIRLSAAAIVLGLTLACAAPRYREQVLAADSAHARATVDQGLAQGFAAYLTDDAVYLEPGTGYIRGKARIEQFLGGRPAGTGLAFHPARAVVSADGSVGYTFGWTELKGPARDSVRWGKYIAFWRRQPDGRWKVEAWNRSGALDAPAAPPAGLPEPDRSGGPFRKVDVPSETRALLGVDSAFAAASVARGTAYAFPAYAAPYAVALGGGRDFVVGREAIRKEQTGGTPGQVLDWKPAFGNMGPLGDLGWTVGDYVFTVPGNPPRSFYGKYLTVWEREPSGSWQYAVDGGSPNPAPGQSPPAP
jgi:ketosteroid isomerase-like protein